MHQRRFVQVVARGFAAVSVSLLGCSAGLSNSAPPTPNPPIGSSNTLPAASAPLVSTTWPIRTREHVDLWLHAYALVSPDTTLVPYFRRGYRERINAVRAQRGVSSLIETNRGKLLARAAVQPALLTSGQFLPLYFATWEQMRQTIDLFARSNGDPGAASNETTRMYFAVLASVAQSAADREWLRSLAESADDESRKFYHEYWTAEARSHAAIVAHTDSLWQRQWRPALQRFLNNSQQQNGELYLSLPLGGEGRTIHYGKQDNAVAGPMPDALGDAEVPLYVVAHEIAGAVASAAIADNTTPADQRAGLTSRYEQAAAVRAGALLLERTIPGALPGYMRYYLAQAGRPAPTDARAAFVAVFAIPDPIRAALTRQLDVILGGI